MPLIKFDGPEGPEEHVVPIGPNGLMRLHLAEVRHIQRVANLTAGDLQAKVFTADPDPVALTALVQVLWKRRGRVVKFDDVDFDFSTLDYDLLPEEEDAVPDPVDESAVVEEAPDPTQTSSGSAAGEG